MPPPLSTQSSTKRAESPTKKSSLPSRPADQNVEPKVPDTANYQEVRVPSRSSSRAAAAQPPKTSSLSQRHSVNVETHPQQGPQQKPSGARPPRELPDGPRQTGGPPSKPPTEAADEIQRLNSEYAESKKTIQELKRLLDEQSALYKEVVSDRHRFATQAEENRKLWKQTARELRKTKQTPGLHQITDSQLTGLIQQLRYSIRDFAVQYFTGISRTQVNRASLEVWELCMVATTPGTDAYLDYIRSPNRCASIIQAMSWRLLESRVFNQFVWAGKAGDSLCDLRFYLKHASRHEPTPDLELERRFQMWSAEATALILQMCDFTEGSLEYKRVQSTKKEIRAEFWDIADQYLSTRSGAPGQAFRRILDNAIALDKEIHQQAARITWEFPPEGIRVGFNPKLMEAEKGQQRPKPDQQVLLVVVPAVKKRGKSDGQDFQAEEQLLVPMEVSCQPPTDIPPPVSLLTPSWLKLH
ncbi:hypothetical protein BJX76DRAFT_356043 [Aspergillus varians]